MQNHVRAFFSDHDRGGIGIARSDGGENRGVNHPQILHTVHTQTCVYHASCTCAMGTDASNSVVDARLRVHGMHNLRVIDASVFPAVTSGNTNAPSIMVAEKGADMVLQDQA